MFSISIYTTHIATTLLLAEMWEQKGPQRPPGPFLESEQRPHQVILVCLSVPVPL